MLSEAITRMLDIGNLEAGSIAAALGGPPNSATSSGSSPVTPQVRSSTDIRSLSPKDRQPGMPGTDPNMAARPADLPRI